MVDEYIDENLSGAGTYRPEFERLIKDCQSGKLDIVMCKSQSRFSRDMEIIEKYLHNKFIEWDIRFISLSDYADTMNPGNKKARQINGLVNEWYLEDVSNNIKSAFRAKMINGEYISPFTVFGYEIDLNNNNKLVIDKYASFIIKKIYKLYLEGYGFLGIANYLNKNKIPSPSYYKFLKGIKLNIVSNKPRDKIKWNASAIKNILTNEIYIGNLIQGKRTTVSYKNHKIKLKNEKEWIKVCNTHDAIIDDETFFKVRNLINERKRSSSKNGLVHLFSGKVFCLCCGGSMKKKNSGKHDYLICANSQNNCCTNKKSIRYDILKDILLNYLNNFISNFYDYNYLEKIFNDNNFFNKKIIDLDKMLSYYNNKLFKIDFYIKNLYEDKVNGIINLEQFNNFINVYNNDKKNYINLIANVNKKKNSYIKKEKNINENIFNKDNFFNELNVVIVNEFIDKIYINEVIDMKRNIQIIWNI